MQRRRIVLCLCLGLVVGGGTLYLVLPTAPPAQFLEPITAKTLDHQVLTAPLRPTAQTALDVASAPHAGPVIEADLNLTATPNASEAEVSLAQDRRQPRRLVAVTMTSPSNELLALASDDAGRTFSASYIPPPPGASRLGDPWVRFDSQGVAHLACVVDVGYIRAGVSRSADGGRSWSPVELLGVADKPALIADDNLGSPFRDRLYVVWTVPLENLWITRSVDGGVTWDRARIVANLNLSSSDLAVADDGTLYLAAQDIGDGQLYVWRSDDGGDSFTRSVAGRMRARFRVGNPASCRRRPTVQMSLGVDKSGGPRQGTVYLTWSDYPAGINPAACGNLCDSRTPCAPDVFTARSTDGGRNWSASVQVNPPDGGTSDQFHSISAVDPFTGDLHVTYHDTRLSSTRQTSHVFLTRSTDGGRSFAPPSRISTAASRSTNAFGYGDYRDMVARNGLVVSVWSDYRSDQNRGEIYLARSRYTATEPPNDDLPCPLAPGHPRYCVDCGPCEEGQGDCDPGNQCQAGTVCVANVGADFGFAPHIDVCLSEQAPPTDCALPLGHPRYCVECGPCQAGQGDCDGDDQCAAGLECAQNIGVEFGFDPRVDVCR